MFGGIRHKLKQAIQRRRINSQIQRMMKRVKADNEVFDSKYAVDTATDVLLDATNVPEEATTRAQATIRRSTKASFGRSFQIWCRKLRRSDLRPSSPSFISRV